jgi:transposase
MAGGDASFWVSTTRVARLAYKKCRLGSFSRDIFPYPAICSRCHLPAPGYDQLAERRFEFIPLWGFLVCLLYAMRRVDCRRCGAVVVEEVPWGDGKRVLSPVRNARISASFVVEALAGTR